MNSFKPAMMSPGTIGLLVVALVGLVRAPSVKAARASGDSHYVVAHWLVPMSYQIGQSDDERRKDDVRAALEEGLDGFVFDAFSGAQAKGLMAAYIAAADSIGAATFKVALSADMSLAFSGSDIVDTITAFGNNSHYLAMNGKPLLSTYGNKGNLWWQTNVIEPLRSAGKPVTFVPYFDRPNPNRDDPSYEQWTKAIQSFTVIDGLFNFLIPGSTPFYAGDPNLGRHWWSTLEGEENLAKALHDQNKIFIAPYMPYYWAVCHPARQYMEYQGGRGMDNTWRSITTRQNPAAVEIVTWNDYSESTFIQPTRFPATKIKGIASYPHLGYYELLKYYISWYHTGKQPIVSKDSIFFFYRPNVRSHAFSSEAADPFCALGPVKASQLWGNIQNVIYVTTAAVGPSELRVTTGLRTRSFTVPAGLQTTDVQMEPGPQTIELWRNGRKLVGSRGLPVSETSAGDNFNVYAGYAVAGGADSETWKPSDSWKKGATSDWFDSSK
jgi:Glycosyl hydrolase family 71